MISNNLVILPAHSVNCSMKICQICMFSVRDILMESERADKC